MNPKSTAPPSPPPTLRDRAEVAARASATDIARMSPEETRRLVHKLQAHQIQLEMQNEELRRTKEELAQSRDRYSQLYDLASIGYVTLGSDATVLEANLMLATMLGVKQGKLIGSKFTRFVAPGAEDTFHLHQGTVAGCDVKQACCLDLRRADGTTFPAQMETIRLRDAVSGALHSLSAISGITAPRQAAQQLQPSPTNLQESDVRFRVLFEAAPIGIAQGDVATMRFLSANRSYCDIIGYTRDELNTLNFKRFTHPDDLQSDLDNLERLLAGEFRQYTIEKRFIRKDGSIAWCSLTLAALWEPGEKPETYIAVLLDITARKQAELALRENEQRFRTIGDHLPGGVIYRYGMRADGSPFFSYLSGGIERSTGYSAGELLEHPGKAFENILPEDAAAMERATRESAAALSPFEQVFRRRIAATGGVRWFHSRSMPHRQEDGTVVWDGVEFDITEQKHAAEARQQSDTLLRAITDHSEDMIFVKDPDSRLLFLNPAGCRLVGLAAGQGDGLMDADIYPESAQAAAFVEADRRVMASRQTEIFEEELTTPDGEQKTLLTAKTPRLGEQGQVVGIIGIARDITERKRAEAALRESETRYRSLFNSIDEGFCVIEMIFDDREKPMDFRFLEVNPAFGQQTGLRKATGKRMRELEPDLEANWFEIYGKVALTGEAIRFTNLANALDGRWFDVYAFRVGGPDSLKVAVLLTNITERKKTEEALALLNATLEQKVAERTTELGNKARLLAGQNARIEQAHRELAEKAVELALTSKYKSEFLANMSHELRTPLNSILIFSQLLAENKAGHLTAQEVGFSHHIHSSGKDLLDLITDILDLAKIESGTVGVRVGEITFAQLRETMDLNFRHLAEAKHLPFTVTFAEGLPATMESDPTRLKQILKNLVSNAIKFTTQGKVAVRVDLAIQGWSPDHPVLSKVAQVVSFAVADTGIGIAPEKQRLVFEAFQQADSGTARKYGGTGLGLSISNELAALLGGEIQLASVAGEGSTFTLYLPFHHSDRAQPGPARIPLMPHRSAPDEALRGGKVLVVDDDGLNIFALVSLLESQEMEVLCATNGREAIEIIHTTPGLGLVLMDIMMPGMDGYDTMREIREDPAFHTLPIIVLTGNAMKGDREKCLDAGACDYLAKPADSARLLELIRRWIFR